MESLKTIKFIGFFQDCLVNLFFQLILFLFDIFNLPQIFKSLIHLMFGHNLDNYFIKNLIIVISNTFSQFQINNHLEFFLNLFFQVTQKTIYLFEILLYLYFYQAFLIIFFIQLF
jgi:hypothetical protein